MDSESVHDWANLIVVYLYKVLAENVKLAQPCFKVKNVPNPSPPQKKKFKIDRSDTYWKTKFKDEQKNKHQLYKFTDSK